MKDESGGFPIQSLVSPSCKQHIITTFHPEDRFPHSNRDAITLCKKVKGVPKKIQKNITYNDFLGVTVRGQKPKTVETARLQRSRYMIYLTKQTKKSISKLSRKRLYFTKFKTDSSFFSFPLNWKSCLL